jgi:hypothetical protein
VSDEESDNQERNEEEITAMFFNRVVPGLWVGLLDMIHDLWVRLGDFMEQQSKIFSEVMGTEGADDEEESEGDVIQFPNKEDN